MKPMATTCPSCGKANDMHDAADWSGQHTPSDGDLSLCIGCGEFSVFEGNALRAPTEAEVLELATNAEAFEAKLAWHRMRAFMGGQR